ncbi:unnamed protein product [Rhizophagus irregularis]|uniref:FAR1 domain-containing protein n=3 Tax=Rhizophagus irregularis TaxID=588596 RepID=A0A915ZMQ4_9GLOM|nr:unnamed protein product [Rhizophagus irregularis]
MECLYDNTQGTPAEEFNLEETIEVIEDVKNNDESNITSGPILGLELEGQEASNYPLLAQPIELSVGTRFSSWIIAEHYLKEYGRQKGFVVNRYRVEYSKSSADPNNRIVKKRTFACENAGRYKPNKTRPIEQQRNKGSKKTNCKWHINLSKPESNGFIHITFVYLEHNHTINADNTRFATSFRKFDNEIMSQIEHAVVHGHCDAHTIRNLLQPLFPNQLFLTQDLSNAIQKIKREKKVAGSDASQLLKFLLKQQKDEPTMVVQPLINVDSNRLCAGMQSTQRVESINAVVHKAVASSSSMADVVEALDSRMQKEALNKSFIAWKYNTTVYHQPFVIESFFSKINSEIKKYFSPRIVEEIHKQMCESILYRCERIDIDEAFAFDDDQLYQDDLAKNSMDQMDLDITSEAEIIKNNEDCYDYRQLMVENQDAVFHILLMSARWLQDNAWENIESLYNEPFISAGGHKSQNTTLQGFIPRHYKNVQEVQVRHQMQKKMEYGRIMGHFKKALNYSIEENDQKNLDNLILSYIANKEKQRENTQLAVIEGHQTSDDIVKLSDGRVYNASDIKDPLAHRGKGRPPTKRLRAFNEETNKAGTSRRQQINVGYEKNEKNNVGERKCGLCHKTGHYAPKCPGKENV